MISQEKVFVYQKYSGDYSRSIQYADIFEKSLIDELDWRHIQELLQELSLVKSGSANPILIREVRKHMEDRVENDPTRKLLFDIA